MMDKSDILENEKLAAAYNRGLEAEKSGDLEAAARAYRAALELDPDDHGGVAVRLAALGLEPSPSRAPEAYVETLFDQQAGLFEHILVDQLGYAVPRLMVDRLQRLAPPAFHRVLDLGCGTGLVARALGTQANEIIGIDLSEAMIDLAEEADLYDGLYVGEAVDFLIDNEEAAFDLIVAADVLPYLGELDPLFAGVAANLAPKGMFVFSTELLATDELPFKVTAHQRFAHGAGYVAAAAERNGFALLHAETINVRNQDGEPSPGQLVVAERV